MGMSFQSSLANLRAQPEHVQKRYAFWASFVFTLIIAAFWARSFSPFMGSQSATVAEASQNLATPAQSMVASVGSFLSDIRDIVFGARKVTYSSVEVSPGKN
jgi:hypothetical protein